MPDSLNNFIDKAGKRISDILGNKTDIPNTDNHSGNYIGPGEAAGINRTDGISLKLNPNPSPGQLSPAKPLSENGKVYPAGFTPVSYYRTEGGEYMIKPGGGDNINPSKIDDKFKDNLNSYSNFDDKSAADFKFGLSNEEYSSNWPDDSIPLTRIDSKNDRETFDGSFETKSWEKSTWWSGGEGTPYENEDPVYFGFELEIDVLTSPLINGQALEFINKFGGTYKEIESKKSILDSFIYELSRYFRFNTDKIDTRNVANIENLFGAKLNKKFYLKKIDGLDKLIEGNQPETSASFIKYKKDVIKLAFQEDTNLNTGTLAALYKLLYWSRINGKNIIPENLLRFDCKLVVSEARNIARVRRAVGQDLPDLEVIKENVSRYVYNIYECQFFFKTMTHPNSIDISQTPTFTDNWEVEITYKFSDMKFERFVFDKNFGSYKTLNNAYQNPLEIRSIDSSSDSIIGDDGITSFTKSSNAIVLEPTIKGYSGIFNRIGGGVEESKDVLKNVKDNNRKSKFLNALEDASDKLVKNLRRAALNESQRQLNDRFRLLNNTLDKVRNSFGVGRLSPPTNIYTGAQQNSLFFDVRDSLRNFTGDTLSGTIFGEQ